MIQSEQIVNPTEDVESEENQRGTIPPTPISNEMQSRMPRIARSQTHMRTSGKRQTVKESVLAKKRQELELLQNQAIEDNHGTGSNVVERIRNVVNSNTFSIVMSIITVYALFADDVRVIAFGKEADATFWVLSCVCFGAFSIEIILSSITQSGYFLGFYFWLDLLSTLSLLLDIGWISRAMFGTGGAGSASSVAALAKASRASRVGTRAGRIVRVVRLIRLVRLYKHAQLAFKKQAKKFEEEQRNLREEQARQNEERFDSASSSFNLRSPGQQIQIPEAISIQGENPQNINLQSQTPTIKPFQTQENDEVKSKKASQSNYQAKDNMSKRSRARSVASQKDGFDENKSINMSRNEPEKSMGMYQSSNRDRLSVSQSIRNPSSLRSSRTINSVDRAKIESQSETKVGKTLSEATTKTVIIIVLCIMFSLPIFNFDTYTQTDTSFGPNLQLIYNWKGVNNDLYEQSINNYVNYHRNVRTPLIFLEIDNQVIFPTASDDVLDYKNEREDDLSTETYSDSDGNLLMTSVASRVSNNELDGILSIIRTLFVSVVLTIASMQFSQDVEIFILGPIEKMLEKVKRIAKNPLEAASIEEKEEFAMQQLQEEGNNEELKRIKETQDYETVVLEKLIVRVGALLALGFGEAGSEIIATNMAKSGIVDPMIPGSKIMAIFGFCDIRNFTDATEVLQTGVMVFVNEIAQITHGTVDQYLGQANKNIGDAFLLVWKFREQDYLRNGDGTLEFLKNDITSNYADLSVIAFLKVMAAITLSVNLIKYKKNPGLQARMKGYRVKMGFGLHFGWAIEGAIGSDFKIDASYLSPNVNMASRLEAATKQFGTGLLISGGLRDILSEKCQQQLRKIDRVTVKGSIEPIDLYTADADLERLYRKRKGKDAFNYSNFSQGQIKKKKIVDKMLRNSLRVDVFKGTKRVSKQFDTDPDLIEMRKEFTEDFMHTWQKGIDFYIEGKWMEARVFILKTLNRQDGPSQTIYQIMKETGFVAPPTWKGFRELTEK